MSSKAAAAAAEDHCNTETEEGTAARQKKRSRRVSFAEITSVHIFNRDDEYETPPDQKPSSDPPQSNEGGLEFLTDGEDSAQNEERREENEDESPFFRPFDSPSPGSTVGSAASNDEDNFFGPVSTSFIRPGRFSDSAASDENHDITMDSTAFSMHFRSLARSESGGDLKTPTGVHLSFEEKTPTQNTLPANEGSSMVLTVTKKPISVSSPSVDKLSGGTSNDMSLVGENPHRYDYGRLSPGLDALLAEGSKDLHAVSVSDNITTPKTIMNMKSRFSPTNKQSGPMEPNGGRDKEMGTIDAPNLWAEAVSLADKILDDANGGYNISPLRQIPYGFSSDKRNAPTSDVSIDKLYQSPNHLTKGLPSDISKESDAFEIRRPNSDFDAVICGTPSNLDKKVQQIDVFAPTEYESPLTRSMSSLYAKQRRIVLDGGSPSKNLLITTPSQKQPGSFLRDETRKQSGIVSSIQRSISKLRMLEASPFSSTFKVNDSALVSSDIFKTSMYNTVLDRGRENAQIKYVDASVACSEDQLFIVAEQNGEPKCSTNMEAIDIETLENNVGVSQAKVSTGFVKVGLSPRHISSRDLCREQPIKLMEEDGLLSQITWSGNKRQKNLLTSGDPAEGMVVPVATDSSLMEITVADTKDKKTTGTPHRTVHSSEKNMESTSLASKEYGGSLYRDLRLYDQENEIKNIDPGHDADSRDNRDAKLFTTSKLDSLFVDGSLSGSPILEINHPEESTESETMDGQKISLHALQGESGAMGNFQTPLTDKEKKKIRSTILDGSEIGTDLARFKELAMGGVKLSCGSASPFVHRSDNEVPSQKQVVELVTQSPSREERHNSTHNDRMHSVVVEDAQSPNSSQLTDLFENLYARKRRRENATARDGDSFDGICMNWRSPKLYKSDVCDSEFLSKQPNEGHAETSTDARETRFEHWVDVFSKFSADAKQLISPSTDKLNLKSIDVLEDVLVNLRRLQMYEMLCRDTRSQKLFDNLGGLHRKRIAETKLLLHRFAHEQAKLQLMFVKRERLLKKLQLLSSGIQESQMLKSHSLPRLSVRCARDSHVANSHCQSVNFEGIQEDEGVDDEVTALRQVLDDSERKVTSLSKSFHNTFKKKGQLNCGDTTLLVNDLLKKKACCRFIRWDMQLWDVDNLDNTNGHHNIVLNYLGFIIQRFTIKVGPVSSVVISTNLNDVNILKNFPNMDVCSAFAFVLNAYTTRKDVGTLSLAQETQTTSSVLGNLLDVAEEVQVARVELQNLTYANFCSPSAEQLELHLHFIDLKSGRKAALTLDMSCLKWGIYPSEVTPAIPSPLVGPADVSRKLLPEPTLADIRAVAQGVRVGYLRIIRICRCVSELVQAWS